MYTEFRWFIYGDNFYSLDVVYYRQPRSVKQLEEVIQNGQYEYFSKRLQTELMYHLNSEIIVFK